MNKSKLLNLQTTFSSVSFGLMFLLLPVSSFPLLSKIFGGTSVAPLSIIPAFFLIIFLAIPTILKQPFFSEQTRPLFLFFLSALVSTLLVSFQNIPSFRDVHYLKNALEGVITFLMGFSFYYLCSHFLANEQKIAFVLRWMNLGAIFLILFSALQAAFIKVPLDNYPSFLRQLTYFFSSSGKVFPNRISGLAFEPSWLAHQLNMLYLPIWLGFTIKNYSVYKIRFLKKITVENLFLIGGISLLFLSFSRIGWLTLLGLIVYLIIRGGNIIILKFIKKLEDKKKKQLTPLSNIGYRIGMWIVVLAITISIGFLMAFLISKLDPNRTSRLFDILAIKQRGIMGWANLIHIAERFIYWTTGFKVFQIHPWIGVGLGAIGYHFQEAVHAFGYKLPEVVHYLNSSNVIPNAKNLWIRLLAETGIIGTAFFIAWLFLQWKTASELEKCNDESFFSTMGLVGKLLVIAFIIEGFSMDTFGLPYYWVAFGLVVAAWRLLKKTSSISEKS